MFCIFDDDDAYVVRLFSFGLVLLEDGLRKPKRVGEYVP
jgi:hypothetical protein